MINIIDMANFYISLTNSVTAKLDELYTADKIDAETYAKIIAQSFENAMQLSVTAVQQQVQIDKDIEVKNAQISLLDVQKDDVIKSIELKAAQINSTNAERAVLANNAAKAGAERALLAQKLITEQDGLSTAASQRSVLAAQATGYAKDAEQKSADILMKGFAVLANANDFTATDGTEYGLSKIKLTEALNKL